MDDGKEEAIAYSAAAVPQLDPETNSPWLHAWHDPIAGLHTFSSCMTFADLEGTGEQKLLVADQDKKLKVFAGTQMASKHSLLDAPVALCTFYPDNNMPRRPSVAVASGQSVFIYRNLRPYFKFNVPNVELTKMEIEAWTNLRAGAINLQQACEILEPLRGKLSNLSLDLLAIEDAKAQEDFVVQHRETPIVQQTVITCMATINKNNDAEDAVSSLIIGTENCQVLILDPPGAAIIKAITLVSQPVMMTVSGLYDVEYRIVVACRDGKLYAIKNGELVNTVIELETHAVALWTDQLGGKIITVATMNNCVHTYSAKGKKAFTLYLPCPIMDMLCMRIIHPRIVTANIIALANGEIRTYNNKTLVATLRLDEPIIAMKFGSYQRQDSTLAMINKKGALMIKMLKRGATLEVPSQQPGPPPEQDIPLNVPKKTKMYVDQTQRERESAIDMHRHFQRDLCKIRLATARSYVKAITDGQGPMSTAPGAALRLNAQVNGLGPTFIIKLSINNDGTQVVSNLPITVAYNHELYQVKPNLLTLPLLIPRLVYQVDLHVKCINDQGGADVIKVFICSPKSCRPVISAYVTMPLSATNLVE